QVTYLAYPGTSGMRAMDWRLTDACLDPPGGDQPYTERSLYLESYWCYEAPTEAPPVGELPAIRNGGVTFGCLNNFAKVASAMPCGWVCRWSRCVAPQPSAAPASAFSPIWESRSGSPIPPRNTLRSRRCLPPTIRIWPGCAAISANRCAIPSCATLRAPRANW